MINLQIMNKSSFFEFCKIRRFSFNIFIKKWGSKGTGDGQFKIPYSVDVDSKGDVWVADRGNHRIQKFDKDGNFITKFGSVGKGNGQFTNPEHLAVDSAGNVYVSDRKANTIQVFKPIA